MARVTRCTVERYGDISAVCAASWPIDDPGRLASEADSATVDDVMEAIIRQLALDAVEPDVCAYLLRRKKEDKSFAEFVEAGSAYRAQASFVSKELVEAIKPPCVGTKKMRVQPFGSQPVAMTAKVYRLDLELAMTAKVYRLDLELAMKAKVYRLEINGSTTLGIEAIEKPDLELAMTRPSTGCRQRWAKRGIELSGTIGRGP